MLNISKGNMYPFVSHTFNIIKGKCSHDCVYCYMKLFKQNPIRLDEREFKTNLGKNNFIFVGSSTDMFARDVPQEWINKTLDYCHKSNNKYLFQTKNPARFNKLEFPKHTTLACTIETNRQYPETFSKAPPLMLRYAIMASWEGSEDIMISIEPIMDFDVDILTDWIDAIRPHFVSIGADSQHHNLPEPTPDKVEALINNLKGITEVVIKDNLKRLRIS